MDWSNLTLNESYSIDALENLRLHGSDLSFEMFQVRALFSELQRTPDDLKLAIRYNGVRDQVFLRLSKLKDHAVRRLIALHDAPTHSRIAAASETLLEELTETYVEMPLPLPRNTSLPQGPPIATVIPPSDSTKLPLFSGDPKDDKTPVLLFIRAVERARDIAGWSDAQTVAQATHAMTSHAQSWLAWARTFHPR